MTGRYAAMYARATGDREIPHELAIPLCAGRSDRHATVLRVTARL